MDENQQFKFGRIQHQFARSREIGSMDVKSVGVEGADVSCACGHQWTARRGNGLDSVVGAIRITCPDCNVSEAVHPRLLGL